VDRVTFIAARFDPHAIVPGDSMAYPRLWTSGRDHHGIAEHMRSAQQRLEAGSINAVVIGQKEFHAT
jgi:hypothetical protein